jgi:lipoyl(octanoyl) transferase
LDADRAKRVVDLHDLSSRLVPYQEGWDLQRSLVEDKLARPETPDALVLLQHPPTYTLGTGSTPDNLLFDPSSLDAPADVFRIERGGEVTFHGPGQVGLADGQWITTLLHSSVFGGLA